MESMAQTAQQKQQMEQMQIQSQMQQQQAQTQLYKARAVADQGLGLERVSRVEENKALAIERQAQARKDDEIGFLNLVKALKEIDGADLEHIERLLIMSNTLKMDEAALQ